jgi:hypothetical protein
MVLLGAEGVSETKDKPWIRQANDDEVDSFREDNPKVSFIDATGRPYWVVVVDCEKAPDHVVRRVDVCIRMVRF